MRAAAFALLVAPLVACAPEQSAKKRSGATDDDFNQDHWVRILSPTNGRQVEPDFLVEWSAGADVSSLLLEADGAVVKDATALEGDVEGTWRVSLDEGTANLRLVGLDDAGAEVSEHSVRIRVAEDLPWVTVTSPSDGAIVPNPVHFTVESSPEVDSIEIQADDWTLGTVSPGQVLTYDFTGTGFEREIDILGYDEAGELIASDAITITVEDGTVVGDSSFGDIIVGFIDDYPRDGSYAYWWPSGVDWGGNPHDIYYLGRLFAAGDPENRSFCVGLTFEVFMRAFDVVDRDWGGDGSLNGIGFDELYTFRTDWYVRDLYGMGIVDAMNNYGIGSRVTSWDDAVEGDIIQFWRHSGSGHNAIFIDWLTDSSGAKVGFTYWSTQGSTDGVGYNDEYFGSSGGTVDPSHFFLGRVADPDEWVPWY